MNTNDAISDSTIGNRSEKPPVPLLIGAILLIAAGAGAFVYGIFNGASDRMLQIYLVNFIFWIGLAFGAMFFVSLLNITNAKWGRPLKRMAEALGVYLPVAFFLFWVLFWGRETLFPWILEPIEKKAFWLNVPFFFAREGVLLFVLIAVAAGLIAVSVKNDRAWLRNPGTERKKASDDRHRTEITLSWVFAVLYVLIMTVVSWDLIMSLSPEWTSSLFGPYFFIGCLYAALSAVFVLTVISRRASDLSSFLKPRHFHDLGKMQLAFLLVTGDFFFSQYLLIWYGNVPEETKFLILRFKFAPWQTVSIAVLFMIFVIPFVVLLNRKVKMKPNIMLGLSLIVLIGMWLQDFLLVIPSLRELSALSFGVLEVFVSIGFLGLMALCVLVFLRNVPLVPIADPLFREEMGKDG